MMSLQRIPRPAMASHPVSRPSIHSLPDGESDGSQDSDREDNHHHPGRDAKRRRIAKACDTCRAKKIKCDGKLPQCSYCETHNSDCLFTYNNKKRQPPRSAKYVEALEARLAHMETLLQSAGMLPADGALPPISSDPASRSSISHSPLPSTSSANAQSPATFNFPASTPSQPSALNHQLPRHARPYLPNPESARRKREPESGGVENLADEMCSLVTNNMGETKYIGSSSSMTILSPRGTQWIKEKTGDDSFSKMVSEMTTKSFTWYHWKPEIFGDLFIRRTYQPLPSKQEALERLALYFAHCNCMFPLFHEPTFMHLVEKQYSHDPFEGSGWWACLNIALAISHRMRAHGDNENAAEDGRKAWLYMKNALAVLSELTLRNNDLLSVQALAGMAIFLQGTPNPYLSFYLVGAAIRLAQGLGLHKSGNGFKLNEVETEQRKRVFWILYMMDKDISLRAGRPAAQDDDDMNIGLPSEQPADQIGTIPIGDGSSGKRVNLFRKLCEFAEIQALVYKRLYADRASGLTDGELLTTIGELDKDLEDWKDSLPIEVRPEHEIKVALPFSFTAAVLHFAYYNCLTTVHRVSILHRSWTSRSTGHHITNCPDQALNPRVFMSAALCVNAARASISLVSKLPPLHNGCTWIVMYYPISALLTLFGNILQNPTDARGESDLQLMQDVLEWLSTLQDEDTDGYVKRMRMICSEFERVSRLALEKAKREQHTRAREQHQESSHVKNITKPVMQKQEPSAQIPIAPKGSDFITGYHHANGTLDPSQQHQQERQGVKHSLQDVSTDAIGHLDEIRNNEGGNGWPNASVDFGPGSTAAPVSSSVPVPSMSMSYNDGNGYSSAGLDNGMGQFGQGGNGSSGMNGDVFQQPFLPQEFLRFPMTLEWDWAELWPQGFDFQFDENSGITGAVDM